MVSDIEILIFLWYLVIIIITGALGTVGSSSDSFIELLKAVDFDSKMQKAILSKATLDFVLFYFILFNFIYIILYYSSFFLYHCDSQLHIALNSEMYNCK